tara:strand:- start:504 stop:650 length:147 start_codon:yes stop_codon:yes gene_type:complete
LLSFLFFCALYDTINGKSNKASAINMQTAMKKNFCHYLWGDAPPQKNI